MRGQASLVGRWIMKTAILLPLVVPFEVEAGTADSKQKPRYPPNAGAFDSARHFEAELPKNLLTKEAGAGLPIFGRASPRRQMQRPRRFPERHQ